MSREEIVQVLRHYLAFVNFILRFSVDSVAGVCGSCSFFVGQFCSVILIVLTLVN